MKRRNRTQEEHAIFEEQTSTHTQMIVSAIEASNKELLRKKTRKQEPLYVRKIKKQEKRYEQLQKILKTR